MNPRRLNNNSMTHNEYRIDLNSPNNIEDIETVQEDLVNQIQQTNRPNINNDHLHQLINLLKDNLTSTFPFIIILILKAFYEHSAGILMVIFFSASIYHANTVLVDQAALKSSRQLCPVIRVILILIISLVSFLYLFREDKFYLCLIFSRPSYTNWNLSTLLWVLYSTFCIIKMMIMILKGLLILYPLSSDKGKYCLTFRKRGSYFSLLEYLSQFYISLLTIRPWLSFLLYNNNQGNILFSSFLLFFYSTIKFYNLYKSTVELRQSINKSFQNLPFPPVPINELRENMCPICQSEYQDPIILTCKHIFCEECVSSWLDRNASCPLCRSKLPIGQANYRDAFTSGYLIWY
ncbi:unnamed protein product [Rotaria socialis]|uniref:RING-type domain-containing protein n=2 Tax=Rotaria socialis TaxID=392032 RepID=A0A818ZK72_9BILA|nr:unnamed protein product [Rotaria socialis]CAF3526810.1 unnamed protein product [Rotaria socialis]CAF3609992.1 unnamed protein product [Rotaria socialis]CAF3770535.1 unnamed protein product [Rotaria socialis]CAF4463894.1 unnamed protein product [Rotaria socialis]